MLRAKTLLVVGLTMLTLYVLLLGGAYLTLSTRLGEIESQEAKMIASRAADAVSAQITEVDDFAVSLSARDSTYDYVQSRDPRLIAEELSEQALARKKLDFVILLDESGSVIASRAIDLDLESGVAVSADLASAISGAEYLRTPGDPRGGVSGLMRLPDGMAIVAARPVTTRDQYSVPKGTAVVGRYVSDSVDDHLSQATGLSLSTLEPPAAAPEGAAPSGPRESDQAWVVWWHPDDTESMSSYALASGIQGEPALLVRATTRRVVNESLKAALTGAAASLLLVCIAATVTVFVMIDWAVVGPLSRLSEQVRTIEPGDDSLPRVSGIEGGELGELADSINTMLESLERAEQDLRESRRELEVRVEMRTRELWLSELQHRELVERLADAVFSVDRDGAIRLVNERAAELLGRARFELVGTRFETLVAEDYVEHVRRLLKSPRRGDTWALEAAFVVPGRDPVPVELRASAYTDAGEEHVGTQWIARDITERQRFEQQLIYLATHDALTGMANRRAFESALERELADAMRNGTEGAVLWLDLDDFKDINDTLGHRAGDETLVQLSTVLKRNLRGSSLLARVGGDEFAVMMPRVARQEAEAAAERILNSIVAFTFAVAGRSVRIGASVGVVFFPEDGSTVQEVLSNADAAMYRAKDGGRSMVYVSEHRETKQLHVSRMTWNDRLNRALACDDFVVCAQPIMDMRDNSICSHELLIRMRKGVDGVYPPSDFLPVAERLGLIDRNRPLDAAARGGDSRGRGLGTEVA